MHLDRVRTSEAKLSRHPPLIQQKVESYFFPGTDNSPPPLKGPPLFSISGLAIFRFQKEDKSL